MGIFDFFLGNKDNEELNGVLFYFDKVTDAFKLRESSEKSIPLENGKYFNDTENEEFYKGKPAVFTGFNPKKPLASLYENEPDLHVSRHYFYKPSLLKYSTHELIAAFRYDYKKTKDNIRFCLRLSRLSHFIVDKGNKDEVVVKEKTDINYNLIGKKNKYRAKQQDTYKSFKKEEGVSERLFYNL